MHYLDNAATTQVHPQVAECIHDTLLAHWANPSSLYAPGLAAEEVVEAARKSLLAALGFPRGAGGGRLVFTASGTEADNLAIFGAARARKGWGNHLVAPAYEHPGVDKALRWLAENEGFSLTLVPPGQDGNVRPEALLEAVGPKTVLLCAMRLNNETGAMLDVAALAREAKKKNPRLAVHMDAVQAFSKLELGLAAGDIDSCALSAHKLHGPKGIGALYLKKGLALPPVLAGGGQEYGLRPGTENIAYMAGFAKAARLAAENAAQNRQTIAALRAQLNEGLAALGGTELNSPPNGWEGICNVSFPGYKSEVLLHHLERREVYVSSGSACAKGSPSHTLTAMGLPADRVDSALRISFSGRNTPEDVQALLEGLEEGKKKLAKRTK